MTDKEKAAIATLVFTCCHIMNSRGYSRISEALCDLKSKTGNMRSLRSEFEKHVYAVGKLVGLKRKKPRKEEAKLEDAKLEGRP